MPLQPLELPSEISAPVRVHLFAPLTELNLDEVFDQQVANGLRRWLVGHAGAADSMDVIVGRFWPLLGFPRLVVFSG